MRIEKKRLSELNRAVYNPRVDLQPGDEEYESIRYSLERYGLVQPIVWNERTGNVVSGHQRLTVLQNQGVEEIEVSVVSLDDTAEKQLNIALNKTEGSWDNDKLTALLVDLGDDAINTGSRRRKSKSSRMKYPVSLTTRQPTNTKNSSGSRTRTISVSPSPLTRRTKRLCSPTSRNTARSL